MKKLLLDIIAVRKKLIKENKSFIFKSGAETFINKLSYWISIGGDCWKICDRWDKEIRAIMPKNFVAKYEQLCKEHNTALSAKKTTI